MFIQTEATPNPATLKFLPGRAGARNRHARHADKEAAAQSPLAERLFDDSRMSAACSSAPTSSPSPRPTATGSSSSRPCSAPSWSTSCPARRCSHRARRPAQSPAGEDEFFDAKDADTVATIKDLIETRVRPAVAGDGGDITFKGYKEGVVYLHMKGACSGCPSSTATLKHGIQNLLKHFVPEVQQVAADLVRANTVFPVMPGQSRRASAFQAC